MARLLLSIIFVLTLNSEIIFSQEVLWERTFGGKHDEILFDAIPTPDYGFILAGSSISNKGGNKNESNKGDLDYWVWKMDEGGNQEWQKNFGGNKVDLLKSICLTNDGGYILGGTSNSDKSFDKTENALGKEDFWIVKLDAKGGEMWQKVIGGYGTDRLISITQDRDGGYILGGTSTSDKTLENRNAVMKLNEKSENSRGGVDFWIVKLDVNGNVKWQRTLGGKFLDELRKVVQTKDGGYMLGGTSNSPESGDKTEPNYGFGDYWIIKLNKLGEVEWQRTYGGDKDDNLNDLIQTKDGGFLLGGNSNSGTTFSKSKKSKKGSDFWVIKIDKIGNIEWQEVYNFGQYDVLTSIVENKDGTFLLGGHSLSEKGTKAIGVQNFRDKEGINDFIALKIKEDGKEKWSKTFGSNGDEKLRKVFETRDGGYLFAGTSNGKVSKDKNTAKGGNDFWLIKLKDREKREKEKIDIEAIPNPIYSYTNIIVNFEYNSGTINVFDLGGRMILSKPADGSSTLPVDFSLYPSGMYIVEVVTNTKKGSVKVIKK